MTMKRAVGQTFFGFLCGMTIAGVLMACLALYRAYSQPIPYRDVEIVEQWIEDGWLNITATFIKTDCKFVKLVPVGFGLGVTYVLDWRDRVGLQGDRLRGMTTLRIAMSPLDRIDYIDLRTRHDCGGRTVDKVFARLDPAQTITMN